MIGGGGKTLVPIVYKVNKTFLLYTGKGRVLRRNELNLSPDLNVCRDS